MTREAAARIGDPVCHSIGVIGQLAGAVGALAIGAAMLVGLFAIGPSLMLGVGVALVIGGVTSASVGAALLHGPSLMDSVQSVFRLPDPTTGALIRGSGSVLINGLPAIRARLDASTCNGLWFLQHFPRWSPARVASGSSSVWFDGELAARVTEQLECAAKIKSGSGNVLIGGPSGSVLPISATREDSLRDRAWWFIDQGVRSFSLGVLAITAATAPRLLLLIRWDEVLFYSAEENRAQVIADLAREHSTEVELNKAIDAIKNHEDTLDALDRSKSKGYYDSEKHQDFARQVHIDTGGRISEEDAKDMQPFGGDTGPSTGYSFEGIIGRHSLTHDVSGHLWSAFDKQVGGGYGGFWPNSPLSGQIEGILRESFIWWR